ncbi:MAG TPA: alkaline phosphatase family protein [Mycobacterium sp.]|nr:alkaline phosphatase family protein [Mycobacterium sp.]
MGGRLTRRRFLAAGAGAAVAGLTATQAACTRPAPPAITGPLTPLQDEALAVLGKTALRHPGSLPFPDLPPGTDTVPQIQHIVWCMMENHSYDNILGMLGRAPGQTPRGDGHTITDPTPTAFNPYGTPSFTNPRADGSTQLAFHLPTTCQTDFTVTQLWEASHQQYADGTNTGFVRSPSGADAMGYWTGQDLPFTYALADAFPIGDRFFGSLLGQTHPNRRYMLAGTSNGMINDLGKTPDDLMSDLSLLSSPRLGTIFDRLSEHNLTWYDYATSYPLGCSALLYPFDDLAAELRGSTIGQFYADAAAGKLPNFCIVDMNYHTQSQERPQNMVVGETFLASVVQAIGASPQWSKTLLVVNYDENGGYADHVPPPVAPAPDSTPPAVQPGESQYDGFTRYGFRVPAVVVSPYAKRNHVSHLVYDHTSVLAMVERKWNLPALTLRDANANDLTDFLDLDAMKSGKPTFDPAAVAGLPPSGESPTTLACQGETPVPLPPAGSVVPA